MALTTQDSAQRVKPGRHLVRPQPRWSRYSNRTFYLFVSPWLLGFIFLTLFPLAYALVFSFTNFDGASDHWRWIGLRNYQQLLVDADTWYSLGRTLLYTAIVVPCSIIGGLGLALLLNQPLRGISIFRAIFYMPAIVPVVGAVVIWKIIFDRDAGIINAVLERVGIPIVTWLADPRAFTALIVVILWGMGASMIISLAGLQGVPAELREAARVDGANPLQTFWSITLPVLSPVLFFQVVTGIITSLQTLIQPLLLTPAQGTAAAVSIPRGNYLYMVNVYAQFFYNQRFGYGSALLWGLFVIILLITLLVFRSSALWVYYEVEQEGEK